MATSDQEVAGAADMTDMSVGNSKKRKFEEESDDQTGMNQLPSISTDSGLPEFNLTSTKRSSDDANLLVDANPNSNEWQTVDRHSKKKAKKIPRTDGPNYPSFDFASNSRLNSQVKISDLQNLVLYILADGQAPQFVSVRHRPEIRKVVVLMVPGLEMSMFVKDWAGEKPHGRGDKPFVSPDEYLPIKLHSLDLPEELRQYTDMFEYIWPIKTPGDEKYLKMHSPLHAMLTAPLPKTTEEKNWKKNRKGVTPAKEPHGWKNNRVPIPEFLLTAEELLEHDYTLHPALYKDEAEKLGLAEHRRSHGTSINDGWVDTSVKHYDDGTPPLDEVEAGSITAGREVIAMDCEMCMTGPEEFSLTRISLVGWDGSVLLDELVKPDKPITDYVTQYSGITEEMLKPITTALQDIQKKLVDILHPRTILLGHSLNSDLNALKITHPYIIDTAVSYPHPRGPPLKSALKWLAQKYLNRQIQKGHGTTGSGAGHNSIEDAKTCLDLIKQKAEKGKDWGTSDAQGENIFKRIARTGVRFKNQGGSAVATNPNNKLSAAVDWGQPKKGAGNASNFPIGCKSDDEVVEGVIRAVNGDPDGLEIPGSGVDFVWGRLRELEALKGWWNDNKQVAAPSAAGSSDTAHAKDHPAPENPFKITTNTSEMAVESPLLSKTENVGSDTETKSPKTSLTSVDPVNTAPRPDVSSSTFKQATADLTHRLAKIHAALPPCTAFIIYSGSGDPREMSRLQTMQQTFKREYKIKKWDQLSVKWTDVEEQALRKAYVVAKHGLGFVTVK